MDNVNRKYRPPDQFLDAQVDGYSLLPFRFLRLNDEKELVVNEAGDYLIVPQGTVAQVVQRKLSPNDHPDLYADLLAGNFIYHESLLPIVELVATRIRTRKSFLESFTGLHIFVITLRCEHTCKYCQVSRVTGNRTAYDMSVDTIDKAIDLMFRSPNPNLTMEFQGGEALLAFDQIQYAVERAESLATSRGVNLTKVICTNLALATTEILQYCLDHDILLSTSLDGPQHLHDSNRHKPRESSYELTLRGIEMARGVLGNDRVSALMTTSIQSLEYPEEIVDEYVRLGFDGVFLRSVSPYGFAKKTRIGDYDVEQFIDFYKRGLDRVLKYNLNGHFFVEQLAQLFLTKILTPFNTGFVDLQSPAGLINGVIVYNYDGAVYATDESRMLAEQHDFTFKLGTVQDNYEDIFSGEKSRNIAAVWANEALAGCSDCALQIYCGADPVHHHATQNDMYGYRPTSDFCAKNMAVITHLFNLMENDPAVKRIFTSWVTNAPMRS